VEHLHAPRLPFEKCSALCCPDFPPGCGHPSIAKFENRFARHNSFEPPSEFPLTSPYSAIVHCLSGPNMCALTQTYHENDPGRSMLHPYGIAPQPPNGGLYFHSASWVCHPNTCTYVRLLGPCFKTGDRGPFRQHPQRNGRSAAATARETDRPALHCSPERRHAPCHHQWPRLGGRPIEIASTPQRALISRRL